MDYARLRAAALSGEVEEAVTVDTRALIDKVLARYSGEWTTLRELIQNAADAQASTVTVKWETIPSTSVPLPQNATPSDLLQHTLRHHTIRRLVVQNDGLPFSKTDWQRLKRIAEGNPDETKIGAFGVGFYSVFADCEEPFVSSGAEAMAFYWKGNALFTRKVTLPEDQQSKLTTFVLDYRSTTTPVPNLLSVAQFLATSLTFVALQRIEFWIDEWRVLGLVKKSSPSMAVLVPRSLETTTREKHFRLTAAERMSTQIDATFMHVLGWKPQTTSSTSKLAETTFGSELSSLKGFFSRLTGVSSQTKAAKEEKSLQDTVAQDLTATSTSTIFLRSISAQFATSVSSSFAAELERATKKPPPKITRISILTSSYDEAVASEEASSAAAAKIADVFATVLPSKKPGGRIFIGFPTMQTTGAGMHVSAPSVIPTVEREAIDLNARWVRTWNVEMLRATGILARLAFASEMAELDQKLKRMAQANGDNKKKGGVVVSAAADVQKCVPEALHILKTYTFTESTPNAYVAQIIEEGFWTACKEPFIEVFSSRGVLPSTKVRNSSEEIARFVAGIPVVLKEMRDAPLIRKLVDFGLIQDVTVEDIAQELGNKALDREQLGHFLQWITKGAAEGELDRPSVQRLLDVAVATVSADGADSGEVIALGSIKYYHNKLIPAHLPIPPTTMPVAFTASIPEGKLLSLGWSPLSLVLWLQFLIESAPTKPAEQDLTRSDKFAHQVLSVLSKNWDNLSPNSRATVVGLLQNITVMPTKMGMRKPGESFFPSVKLFDDLPTLEGCINLKEKFLVALGVRKTVDLETIFTRLLTPGEGDAQGAKWSHVELIKYLTSVRQDIPAADLKKLRESPLCPAEAGPKGAEASKRSERLYRVCELYEPKDSLRALGLPILQWPGPSGSFRSNSPEAKFLFSLGLKAYPSAEQLVEMMASQDEELRGNAMAYFIANHHLNGYTSTDLAGTDKRILPIEGNEKVLVTPSACYTNERAAVMGYNILRRDLHPHAMKFGVARDPPISGCVEKLIANPPADRQAAVTLFEYLTSRLGDLRHNDLMRLRDAAIVPVVRSAAAAAGKSGKPTVVLVAPSRVYLGSSSTYKDIFDFVDFGADANSFLFKCGAKSEPTKHEIAHLACTEPARLLSVLESPEKYLSLLKSIAEDLSTLKRDRDLYRKMKTSPWLLGSREVPSGKNRSTDDDEEEEDATIKSYLLASPPQLTILDDFISYRLFKDSLLCAPEEDLLEDMYLALGATTLSSRVQEDLRIGRPTPDQRSAEWLRKHVLERAKLFLHEYAKDRPNAVKHDYRWLEKNLRVISVASLALRRTLRGVQGGRVHTESRSAASMKTSEGHVLYVAAPEGGGGKPDMYQVGQAICQMLLTRPNQHAYFFFEPFLKLGLLELRARGYNVDRILRAKAAEARLAEEEKRRALEAERQKLEVEERERKRVREQEQQQQQQQQRGVQTPRQDARMPGAFEEDSPEQEQALVRSHSGQQQHQPEQTTTVRSLFNAFTRRLGIDVDTLTSPQSQQHPPPKQPESKPSPSPLAPLPPTSSDNDPITGPLTSPSSLRRTLLTAIQQTRAHTSPELISPPAQTTVPELPLYCDSTPAEHISFVAEAPRGMHVFLPKGMTLQATEFVTQHAEAIGLFEGVLRDVVAVYELPSPGVVSIFWERGKTVAFNRAGSLFCNLAYFEELHVHGVKTNHGGMGRVEAVTWWWVVLAHELAHNLVGVHDAKHGYYT